MKEKQAKESYQVKASSLGCYYEDVSSLNSIENSMSKEDETENFKQSSIFLYKPFEHTSHGLSDFSTSEASSPEDQHNFDVSSIPLPDGESSKIIEKAKECGGEGYTCVGLLVSATLKKTKAGIADTTEAMFSSNKHAVAPENPGITAEESNEKMAGISHTPEPNLASPEKTYSPLPKEKSNDKTPTTTDITKIPEPKLSSNDHNQDLEIPEGHPEEENKTEGDMAGIKQEIQTDQQGNESLDEAAFSVELLSSTMMNENEADIAATTEAKLLSIRQAVSGEKTENKLEESILETKENLDLESGELTESTLEPGQLGCSTTKCRKISDLEDGEVSGGEDQKTLNPVKASQTDMPICRFYMRSACTWGKNCRFRHPEPLPKGKYQMFENKVLPVVKAAPVTPKPAWTGFIEPSVDPYQPERLARPRSSSPSSFYFNDMDTDPYYLHNQLEIHERAPLLPTPTFTYIAPPPRIHHYPVEMELSMRREPALTPPPPPLPKRRNALWERRRSSSSQSSTTVPESPPSSGSILVSPPRYLHSLRRPNVVRKPSPYRRKSRPEPKRRRFSSSSSSGSSTSYESDSSTIARRVKSSKDSRKKPSNNPTSRHREMHRSRTPVPSSSKRATPSAPKKSRLAEEKSESTKKKQSRQEYLLMKLLKVEKQIAKKKEQNRTLKAINK